MSLKQSLITRFFCVQQPPTPAAVVPFPSPLQVKNKTSEPLDLDEEWALFDQACNDLYPHEKDEQKHDESSCSTQYIPELVASYDQMSNNQRIDPQFPKNSNHTTIQIATNAEDRKLQRMLQWNLDSKEFQAWKDKVWATNVLQHGQVSEEILEQAISVFCGVCRKVEQEKRKNKKRILIGALYYTIKKHEQPSVDRVAQVVKSTRSQVSQALKTFRLLARDYPNELGWIFDVEKGQTSFFRIASEYGLSRQDVKRITTYMKEKGLEEPNDTMIRMLMKKYAKGKL